MGSEEARKLYNDAQKKLLQVGSEVDLEAADQLNSILTKILVEDLEFGLSKQLERNLWKIYRRLIETVTASTGNIKSKENVVNMVISWLRQLSLSLHLKYSLLPHELPPALSLSPIVSDGGVQTVTEEHRESILGFIAFRMGDLLRYKDDLEMAHQLYQTALGLQPYRGEVWNQLGLLSQLRGSLLDAVYYHVRALHAPVAFELASTNISAILRKFSSKEDVPHGAPLSELYLTVLGKLHYMMPVPEGMVDLLGPQLLEVRTIVPLLATYSRLEESTDDEKRCKRTIEQLLHLAYASIIDKISSSAAGVDGFLLSCLPLLLRLPTVSQPNEVVAGYLKTISSPYVDSSHLEQFRCLEDPLDYPIKWTHLAEMLTPGGKKDELDPKKKGGRAGQERRRRTVLVAPLSH